jgi:drug/metabolite transporter (DMT)-like permease
VSALPGRIGGNSSERASQIEWGVDGVNTLLAIVMALLASMLAAVGTVQRQAATAPGGGVGKGWFLGAAVSVGAFGLQVAALVFGAVLLVQPLIVLSVLFELVIQWRWTRRPPTRKQWLYGLAVAAGVVFFVLFARPVAAVHGKQLWVLDLVVYGFLAAVLVTYLFARRSTGNLSGLLFGLISGSMFGLVAVQVNSLSRAYHGPLTIVKDLTLYACIAAVLCGILAQQRAFSRSPLEVSYPAMVASEPVISMVLSMAVLGEKLSSHSIGTYIGVLGLAVMVTGVVGVARSTAGEVETARAGSVEPARAA